MKANAYGHGAVDCGGAALDAGARALCVATVGEALVLRRELAEARLLVLGPASDEEVAAAREARPRARRLERPDSRGSPGAREARHGHGAVGRVGAAGADAGRRRRDDAPRDRRQRPGLRRVADRAVSRCDRLPRAPDATRREQRRGSRDCPSRGSTPPAAGSPSTACRRSGEIRPSDGLEPVLSWTSEIAQTRLTPGRRVDRLRQALRRRA